MCRLLVPAGDPFMQMVQNSFAAGGASTSGRLLPSSLQPPRAGTPLGAPMHAHPGFGPALAGNGPAFAGNPYARTITTGGTGAGGGATISMASARGDAIPAGAWLPSASGSGSGRALPSSLITSMYAPSSPLVGSGYPAAAVLGGAGPGSMALPGNGYGAQRPVASAEAQAAVKAIIEGLQVRVCHRV